MNYPGDPYVFTFVLQHADGSTPTVSSAPAIQIVDAVTGSALLTTPAVMTLVTGTSFVYSYVWNTTGLSIGTYIGLVTYAADGHAVNNQYLERVKLGDRYVTGPVALDSTVAKDATVAKDSTVLHARNYVSPDSSTTIQGLIASVADLPSTLPSQDNINRLTSLVQDVWDSTFGSMIVDKTANTMSMFRRASNALLARFSMQNTPTQTARMTLAMTSTDTQGTPMSAMPSHASVFPITPDDNADLTIPASLLQLGESGDVAIITDGGQTITLHGLAAGTPIPFPFRITRVLNTGTTAQYITGISY